MSDYEKKVDEYLQKLKKVIIENKDISELEFFRKLDICIYDVSEETISLDDEVNLSEMEIMLSVLVNKAIK